MISVRCAYLGDSTRKRTLGLNKLKRLNIKLFASIVNRHVAGTWYGNCDLNLTLKLITYGSMQGQCGVAGWHEPDLQFSFKEMSSRN